MFKILLRLVICKKSKFSYFYLFLLKGKRIAQYLWSNGWFPQQFAIQHPNPTLPQTKLAATRGLQVFLRCNSDGFDRVSFAPDQNGTFIALVDNAAVVVMLTKTSPGSGQKCL